MTPALSIIIPHYNHAGKLPRLLNSICAQQIFELEVIVVDDCSEHSCNEVVSAYQAKGLNVRLLNAPEKLYTKNARLWGLKDARAEIIAFADCDDEFCNPPSLKKHIDAFRAAEADILHCNTVTVNERGSYLSNARPGAPFADCLEGSEIFSSFVEHDRGYPVWGKLYAKSLCLHVAPVAWDIPIKRYAEDTCLTTLLLFHARKYVGSTMTGYKHHFSDKKTAEAAERAVYKHIMLARVIPCLAENGCPDDVLEKFAQRLREKLCLFAGRFCQAALKKSDEANKPIFLTDETIEQLLGLADARTWMKILALGNGMNAAKLVRMLRIGLDV